MSDEELKHNIVYKTVSELIPYVNNSRTHSDDQVSQIASSIKEFGFTNPLLIDGNGGIIAGHGRLMAAKKVGLESVPCLVLDHLTKAQQKALVIADNKLALNAGWDDEMLRLEFEALREMDFDLSLTGFSDEELAPFMAEEVEGLTDEDAVPDVPETPVTVEGDVWVLGNHRLMCGDSTSIDVVEKLMDGKKADMVFTDPPYGVEYEGIRNDDEAGLSDLLHSVFSNYLTVSKSGAAIYVFHADRTAHIFREAFNAYFHFSSMIIWVKNSITLSKTDYQSQHEPCLYGWMNNGSHSWFSDRKQTTTWHVDKQKVEGHTTPKPVELIVKAVNNSSKSGDLIVDLFGGSGSTLIGAEQTGRTSSVMELDPKYCDVIINRWQDFTGKEAVHEDGRKFNDIAPLGAVAE